MTEESHLFDLVRPPVAVDDLEAAIFQLCYKQHGGSGTNLTPDYVDQMEWRRFVRWCHLLEDQRVREQAALEKAARKK